MLHPNNLRVLTWCKTPRPRLLGPADAFCEILMPPGEAVGALAGAAADETHDGEPNERAATPGLQKKRLIWIVRSYIGPFC